MFQFLAKKFLPILFLPLSLFTEEIHYEFVGVFYDPNAKYTFSSLSLLLPYNPTFLSLEPENRETCQKIWPKKRDLSLLDDSLRAVPSIDFLWLGSDASDLIFISDLLKRTEVVYTPTRMDTYPSLKIFFETSGFNLLAHWHLGNEGNAAFVRRERFDALMRSLHFSPNGTSRAVSYPRKIDRVFRKIEKDAVPHSFEEIDYIYMINLDERPEKFQLAKTELELYGIHPYRFSAVNGWKLPHRQINQIGVEFLDVDAAEPFRGTVFKEIEGKEFSSNELIKADGQTYFTIGMSRGSIGILLSHLSVLQDAYESGYKTIWVMEDDVQVVGDPLEIPRWICCLDRSGIDWDILFTDLDTKDTNGNRVACRATAARPNFPIPPLSFYLEKFHPLSHDLCSIGMRYGAYSMILRRSGIEKILNYFKMYNFYLPYDMDYWLIPDLKMVSPIRDVVTHRNGAETDNGAPNYEKKGLKDR